MKNILLACTLALTLFSCKTENISVLSFNNKITTDKNTLDWDNQSVYVDPKTNSTCVITNDNNNVYLSLKFKDTLTQMKIFRGGLEISIDTLNKNKYPISIIFPYSIDRENTEPNSYSNTGVYSDMNYMQNRKRLLEISKTMKLIGFKNGYSEAIIGDQNKLNIKASMKFDDSDCLLYELSVPISLFADNNIFRHKAPIKFNFKIMGLPNNNYENPDNLVFQSHEFTLKTKFNLQK